MSRVAVLGRYPTGSEFNSLVQSCDVTLGNELVTADDMKNLKIDGITIAVPSSCDRKIDDYVMLITIKTQNDKNDYL